MTCSLIKRLVCKFLVYIQVEIVHRIHYSLGQRFSTIMGVKGLDSPRRLTTLMTSSKITKAV
jgi:hypothetical protein